MLTLRGAHGLESPYLGYLELDVHIHEERERERKRKRHRLIAVASTATTQLNKVEPKAYKVTVPNCGVLVLKDTAATVQQRRKRPGVLGKNVLAQIPKWAGLLKKKWSETK